MLVRWLIALRAGRNIFQEDGEWPLEHFTFTSVVGKQICLSIADNFNIKSGFLLAFPPGRFSGRLIRIDMTAGRHPAAEAFMPQQQRSLLRINDKGGGGKVFNHKTLLHCSIVSLFAKRRRSYFLQN